MYDIIDEQADFLVLYKKPGASFHSEGGAIGLFESLRQARTGQALFPVHRLDKVTSGLLLVAKQAEANRDFCAQFAARHIDKGYLALSAHKPSKKQGLIKGDMAQARRGSWKLLHSQHNPAITQFFSRGLGEGLRLFALRPHTGKTHQLRVALKSLGAPIVGDELYGGGCTDRTYLHAAYLAFSWQGQRYGYSEMPREGELFLSPAFTEQVGDYRSPWLLPWPVIGASGEANAR